VVPAGLVATRRNRYSTPGDSPDTTTLVAVSGDLISTYGEAKKENEEGTSNTSKAKYSNKHLQSNMHGSLWKLMFSLH
jgi:hypothetical protein